jgi:diguanylate cyclase (GGDEF)-like protein
MVQEEQKLPGNILVIDDDESVCTIIKRMIEKHGHRVESVLSGTAALEMIKINSYDIIITDIRLPDIDGLEILREVKAVNSDTDVIVITGYSSIESAVECMKAGALDYIPKPVNFDHLTIVIDKAVERKELIKAARERDMYRTQSLTDGLTGLFNFKYFHDTLVRKIAKCLRTGEHFSMLMIDIDNFKTVNDIHGHQAGNQVLKEIAGLLTSNCREYDVIARYGGEEFAIILPLAKIDSASRLSDRILRAISSARFNPLTEAVTVSIGISGFPLHATTAEDLIHRADVGLYQSKRMGKNRFTVYESSLENPLPPGKKTSAAT